MGESRSDSTPMKCPVCHGENYSGKLWLPDEKRRDGSVFVYPVPVCTNHGEGNDVVMVVAA